MAGKEAILFLVDCSGTMGKDMSVAVQAVSALIQQKMFQGKSNEVGIVLFGVPEDQTDNKLNRDDPDQYLGVQVLNRLERPSLDTLRRLKELAAFEGVTGDIIDAMVVGLDLLRDRTLNKKYLRSVYMVTDAEWQLQGSEQLQDVVDMFRDPKMDCRFHVVGVRFPQPSMTGDGPGPAEGSVKAENVRLLQSIADALGGTLQTAEVIVNVMGEVVIKTTNPQKVKVPLCIGTSLRIPCQHWGKVMKASIPSLHKENKSGYVAGEEDTGKVKIDRTYRDPEMPEVEVQYDERIKGFRYGKDYIPVNPADEASMKLEEPEAHLHVLGFTSAAAIPRAYYMGGTVVVTPLAGDAGAATAVSALAQAMKRTKQVAVVRFVKRANAGPQVGVLMPDNTGAVEYDRFLYQQLPFDEDLRDYSFPSFADAPPSRQPSAAQLEATEALVDALTLPEEILDPVRDNLVLNPVMSRINKSLVSRAMDPDAPLAELGGPLAAALAPSAEALKAAQDRIATYASRFEFRKQEGKAKKKRTFWSDITIAGEGKEEEQAEDSRGPAAKRARAETSQGGEGAGSVPAASEPEAPAVDTSALKVGSIDPVADFEKMLAVRSQDLVSRAMDEVEVIIKKLVELAIGPRQRAKAVKSLEAYRKGAVGNGEFSRFNAYLRDLKVWAQADGYTEFWEEVTATEITLISSAEDSSCDVTPAQATEFLRGEAAVKIEAAPLAKVEDDDDLLDMA